MCMCVCVCVCVYNKNKIQSNILQLYQTSMVEFLYKNT